jgi:hypothetical protein
MINSTGITSADLSAKKITRIDVFYNNDKKPTLTLSPRDGKMVLANFIQKMINENEG